jgi:hypothetical protein
MNKQTFNFIYDCILFCILYPIHVLCQTIYFLSWIVFHLPQWLWYFITDGSSRTVTKEEAILSTLNYHWKTKSEIKKLISQKYNGKIISSSGFLNFTDISTVTRESKSVDKKIEYIANSENDITEMVISYRIKPGSHIPSNPKEIIFDTGLDSLPA